MGYMEQMPSVSLGPLPKQILGIVLALLILALGVYIVYFSGEPIDTNASGLRFFKGNYATRTLYELQGTTTIPVTFPELSGRAIDYARGEQAAAIVESVDGKKHKLQNIAVLGETPRIVLKNVPGPISGLAVSPDGGMVAYAENFGSATSTDPVTFYAPSAWNVKTIDASGTTQTRGVGYYPQFFERGGSGYLLFAVTRGITVINLTSGEKNTFPLKGDYLDMFIPVVSPDGAYLALLDAADNQYVVFKITNAYPLALARTGALPKNTYHAAFKGHTVYSIAPAGEGTVLYASVAENPRRTETLTTIPWTVSFRLIAP